MVRPLLEGDRSMRCERCGNDAPRITRLRGEKIFICRRCREESVRVVKKPAAPAAHRCL